MENPLEKISTKRLLTLYKRRYRGMIDEEHIWEIESDEDYQRVHDLTYNIHIQDLGRSFTPEEVKAELDRREHVE